MAKVICEACGSSFPLERVKELKVCPVCGESLWDEEIVPVTLMPFNICFVILLKNPSIMFSHDPCVGVNTNSNLPGTVFRYSWVSCEVWAEWLSRIILILSPAGYFSSSSFKKRTKSELLWVGLTSGIASPVTRSIAASRESVPKRTYS